MEAVKINESGNSLWQRISSWWKNRRESESGDKEKRRKDDVSKAEKELHWERLSFIPNGLNWLREQIKALGLAIKNRWPVTPAYYRNDADALSLTFRYRNSFKPQSEFKTSHLWEVDITDAVEQVVVWVTTTVAVVFTGMIFSLADAYHLVSIAILVNIAINIIFDKGRDAKAEMLADIFAIVVLQITLVFLKEAYVWDTDNHRYLEIYNGYLISPVPLFIAPVFRSVFDWVIKPFLKKLGKIDRVKTQEIPVVASSASDSSDLQQDSEIEDDGENYEDDDDDFGGEDDYGDSDEDEDVDEDKERSPFSRFGN